MFRFKHARGHGSVPCFVPPFEQTWGVNVWVRVILIIADLYVMNRGEAVQAQRETQEEDTRGGHTRNTRVRGAELAG